MRRFEERVVLVTGAGSGIGRATAQRLASEGASLFLTDVRDDALQLVVKELAASGAHVVENLCDVSRESDVADSVSECLKQLGKLDVLVCCAGILRFDLTHGITLENWNRVFAVNATGTFLMCRAAIPHLLETRGNIVNIASTAALQAQPFAAAYAASKGAVLAFTRVVAMDYVKRGLRANAVCPGGIDTPMTSDIDFPEGVDMQLVRRTMSPRGTAGPETVASVIAMLASDDGSHITGEAIRIDGGMQS
jgi:NAD(P)-dependent dehydrogenase (short-subunit alcohol dehydrogenase family)